MFAAEAKFYVVGQRGRELDEGRNAEIGDLALEKLPLAEVVGKSEGAVAEEVKNVPENDAIPVKNNAALLINVFSHDRWPGLENLGKERLSMISDERRQLSDVFDAADVERHGAVFRHHLLRTRSLLIRVETVAGPMMRHRRKTTGS